MSYLFKFLKRRLVITIIFLLVGIGIGYAMLKKPPAPAETFEVTRTTLVQEVTVTGKTKPRQSVELAFEKSGKVVAVLTDVGDKINAGQTLVQLDTSELRAQLKAEEAKLTQLRQGTRPEELLISEREVEKARTNLRDAEQNVISNTLDSYTKSDDAIHNKADQLFSNPRTHSPDLNFILADFQLETALERDRAVLEGTLNNWRSSLPPIPNLLNQSISQTKDILYTISPFLEKLTIALGTLVPSTNLTQATIDSYKSNVSTARTNINTALNNITTADEKWRTAKSTLALEEQEYTLKKAGSTPEEIKAQEAQVELILAQIAKAAIRSPIRGIITKQDAKVGQIAPANTPLVAVISESDFELEAQVPEADIAKIKTGNTASITLDAYGSGVIFEATVSKIDPAATVVEGVPTYLTTFHFTQTDEKIKSGMTADITILTNRKERVIAIPQRMIFRKNSDEYVIVKRDEKTTEERKIEIGLRGSDGNVEVRSGLQEGELIVIPKE